MPGASAKDPVTKSIRPLNRESVTSSIINRLTDLLISGELKPGDKLPTEMELAEQLGVGRNSVREAIKMLSYLGVIEIRRGIGTFVANSMPESVVNPLILGLVFGIALGPCTFAYMAPMLGVTFKLAARSLYYGILLLVVYGLSHCSVIFLAGTSTELVQKYLNWNEKSKGAIILKRICGVLVLLGGLYLIYSAR